MRRKTQSTQSTPPAVTPKTKTYVIRLNGYIYNDVKEQGKEVKVEGSSMQIVSTANGKESYLHIYDEDGEIVFRCADGIVDHIRVLGSSRQLKVAEPIELRPAGEVQK